MKLLGMILCLVVGGSSNAFCQYITVDVAGNGWVGNIAANDFDAPVEGTSDLSKDFTWDNTGTNSIDSDISVLSADTSFNLDPTLHYGFAANNYSTSAQTYTMTFTLPLSQLFVAGELVSVSSSISGSAAPGDSGAPVLGLANSFIQESFIGGTDLGAPLDLIGASDLAAVNSSFNSVTSAPFPTYPASGNSTQVVVTSAEASVGTIQVMVGFTLSGDASAVISGNLAVTPVAATAPEPSAYAMLLAGLSALVLAVRRRQQVR